MIQNKENRSDEAPNDLLGPSETQHSTHVSSHPFDHHQKHQRPVISQLSSLLAVPASPPSSASSKVFRLNALVPIDRTTSNDPPWPCWRPRRKRPERIFHGLAMVHASVVHCHLRHDALRHARFHIVRQVCLLWKQHIFEQIAAVAIGHMFCAGGKAEFRVHHAHCHDCAIQVWWGKLFWCWYFG